MPTTKQRPLGATQEQVLRIMREKRIWFWGCGWLWTTPSETLKVLESLVNRDLIVKRGTGRHVSYHYAEERPTQQGVWTEQERQTHLVDHLSRVLDRSGEYIRDDVLVLLARAATDFLEQK